MPETTHSTDGPYCPYCGTFHHPSEDPGHYYADNADTSTCGGCGKDFKMEVYTSHSWTCEPLED